jgi:hypothetical protein
VVSKIDDFGKSLLGDVGKDGFERQTISMNIGNSGKPHLSASTEKAGRRIACGHAMKHLALAAFVEAPAS